MAVLRPGGTDMSVLQIFVDNCSGFYIKNMAAPLLEIVDSSTTSCLGTLFFLIFLNLACGDIFTDCWVTGGVVLDNGMAAQFCTVATVLYCSSILPSTRPEKWRYRCMTQVQDQPYYLQHV
jgi:hypothetical protein